MKSGSKKRRWEEWDSLEKARTREWWKTTRETRRELRLTQKKLNPKNRYRLMIICFSIFVFSTLVLWLALFDAFATYQAVASLFSTILSRTVLFVNYEEDIMTTVVNSLTKSSLR